MDKSFNTPRRKSHFQYAFQTPKSARWSPTSSGHQSTLFDSIRSPSTPKTPSTLPLNASTGYFAFLSDPSQDTSLPVHEPTHAGVEEQRGREEEQEWSKRQEHEERAHKARLEKESAEAIQGEFEWVRSGGILRDAQGRRDKVRTEAIRTEIRAQEEERGIMDKWHAYEDSWRRLTRSGGVIRFHDIPWPQENMDTSDQLDMASMQRFILSTLRVRSNRATRKEIIRAAWLRWHPDKLSTILNRIDPEDEERVREGISMVMVCLKELQGG
ncbi:hypothetical protein ONZ45_g3323 [Pleurotus djamor]|nr:hypothetical protein ONZ45_g3323 [Pleurotus djamor]